jgi:hypothetical protein
LDEVFLKINGQLHYFWRAVDQDGDARNLPPLGQIAVKGFRNPLLG